jgi:enamine deaminase RidA (YjgF/YER057c/UK114 family)
VITATPGKHIFVAGQTPRDAQGNLVGPGDLNAQAEQAFKNVVMGLAAAGARPCDIVNLHMYVAHYTPADGPVVMAAKERIFGDTAAPSAAVLAGVQSLYTADQLIEVEAEAIVH